MDGLEWSNKIRFNRHISLQKRHKHLHKIPAAPRKSDANHFPIKSYSLHWGFQLQLFGVYPITHHRTKITSLQDRWGPLQRMGVPKWNILGGTFPSSCDTPRRPGGCLHHDEAVAGCQLSTIRERYGLGCCLMSWSILRCLSQTAPNCHNASVMQHGV